MRANLNRRVFLLNTLAVIWLLFSIIFNLEVVISNLDELGDFGSFIASGLFLKNGTNPYSTDSPLIFEAVLPRVNAGGKMPNLNPPFSLLAFEWAASGDHFLALNIWRITSLLMYMLSFLLLANQYKPGPLRILWVFALAGLWHTIGLGQIYTILLLLTTLAWLSMKKHKKIQAGIFLGLLVSIKPNFLIWILVLAIQKKWKTVFTTLLVIGFCALLPLLRMTPEVYIQWLEATRVENNVLTMPGNSSLLGLTSRIGITQFGLILGLIFLGAGAWKVFRADETQVNSEQINSIGIFLSLLLSPISWVGYTILTLPFFLSRSRWNYATLTAAAILTLPFNFALHFYYDYGQFSFVFWGAWYGFALLICTIDILFPLKKERTLSLNQA